MIGQFFVTREEMRGHNRSGVASRYLRTGICRVDQPSAHSSRSVVVAEDGSAAVANVPGGSGCHESDTIPRIPGSKLIKALESAIESGLHSFTQILFIEWLSLGYWRFFHGFPPSFRINPEVSDLPREPFAKFQSHRISKSTRIAPFISLGYTWSAK